MTGREVWDGERYVDLGEFEQQLLRTVYRQTGKSSPIIAPPAYAGGMSSEPGGFLIPEGLADGLIDSVRNAMEVRSRPRCVPMTAETIAQINGEREDRFREHRRFMATPEGKAVVAARKAEHEAKRAAERAAAVAEWEEVRLRYTDSPAVLAVLDIHQVDDSFGELGCTHPISGWEAEREEWPCETFEAIRDAPMGKRR